jgi:hypothetical protein
MKAITYRHSGSAVGVLEIQCIGKLIAQDKEVLA